jgi:hypothetical protein
MKPLVRYLPTSLLLVVLLAGMSLLTPAIRADDNHHDGWPTILENAPPHSPARDESRTLAGRKLGEELDLSVLTALYQSTGGDHWKIRSNWLNKRIHHCDGWYGVTCTSGDVRRVIILNLPANQLSGTLPPELGNLSRLRVMNLAANQLHEGIPPELGRLSRLQYLSLAANPLAGPIPPELGRLSQLEYLNLAGDQLSGNIPPELGNLSKLRALYLFANPLYGEIPPELGNLTQLQCLYLFADNLNGDIPPELNRLSKLQVLYLNGNRFSHLPEMDKLVNLQYLYLDNNPWTCFTEPQRRFINSVRVHDIDPHLYPLCKKL